MGSYKSCPRCNGLRCTAVLGGCGVMMCDFPVWGGEGVLHIRLGGGYN